MSDIRDRMANNLNVPDPLATNLVEVEATEVKLIDETIRAEYLLTNLQEADEAHIERWERTLRTKAQTLDVEERRRYLLTLIQDKLKVSTQLLADMAYDYTNVQAEVSIKGSLITVRFLGEMPRGSMARFRIYMQSMIPAHLRFLIEVSAPRHNTLYITGHNGQAYSRLVFN